MPAEKKHDKFAPVNNLWYQVKLNFDEPVTGEGKFGAWYMYSVQLISVPENVVGSKMVVGETYSWFASDYVHDLLMAVAAGKGDVLKVCSEKDDKKTIWHIEQVDAAKSAVKAGTQYKPEPAPGAPKAPQAPESPSRTKAQIAPAPTYQMNGEKWTRDGIANEVWWWVIKCKVAIEEIGDKMPEGEVCKFHNTGLIQSLKLGPHKQVVSSPIDVEALSALLAGSLDVLEGTMDRDAISLWPDRFKGLLHLLPADRKAEFRKLYREIQMK